MVVPLAGDWGAGIMKPLGLHGRERLKAPSPMEILLQFPRCGHPDDGTAYIRQAQGIAKGDVMILHGHL
jgi:hypothetical protein